MKMNKIQMSNTQHKCKGFTLLEMFLVIATSAIIILSVMKYYSGTSATTKANNVVNQVNQIRIAIAGYNQDKKAFPDSVDTLVTTGYLASGYEKLPWGEPVVLVSPSQREGREYSITLFRIPSIALCQIIYNRLKSTLNVQAGESINYWDDSKGTGGPKDPTSGCDTVTVFYPPE